MSAETAGDDQIPTSTGAETASSAPDPAVLDRITDDLLRKHRDKSTVKEVLRALEADLGLPPKYLSAFLNILVERISNVFLQAETEKNNAQGSEARPGGSKDDEEKKKGDEDGEKRKKKKKKKKLKKNKEGSDERPRKKSKLISDKAEDEEEQESDSDEEEEEEEDDDYEYDEFVVRSDEEVEGEEEGSSSSSSSSGSESGSGDEDDGGEQEGGKGRRLVQEDDFELDEDDQALIEENRREMMEQAMGKTTKKKSGVILDEEEEEDEEQMEDEERKRGGLLDELAGDDVQFGADAEEKDEGEGEAEEEFSSGESSGIVDSDDMGDFIEDDDLPEGEEGDRERRRRRRRARRERKQKREAQKKGLINMEDIPQEFQDLFAECFAIDGFDPYLSDDEELVQSVEQIRAKLVDQEEARALYLTPEDDVIRQLDVPERLALVGRKIEFLVNFESLDQVEMQAEYVAKKTGVDVQLCEKSLSLLLRDKLEVPCVHMYHADDVAGLSLDELWAIYDAGLDFQSILRKLLNCLTLIKEEISSTEMMEEKLIDDEFWAEEIQSSLFQDATPTDEEDTEFKSIRNGWLRLLYKRRLALTHDFLDDCFAYLSSLLVNGDDSGSKRGLNSQSSSQKSENGPDEGRLNAIRKFHDRIGSPLALGLAVERGFNDGTCRPKIMSEGSSPQSLAEELFVIGYDPVQVSTVAMAQLIVKEPHIRAFVRDMFLKRGEISTNRTTRGTRVITDTSSRFYDVCNLVSKPITVYTDALERVGRASSAELLASSENKQLDVARRNSEQILSLDIAQREGVIELKVSNASDLAHELADLLVDYFSTNGTDDEWESLRRKCLKDAVDKLVMMGRDLALRELTRRAKETLLKRVSRDFFKRVCMAPVNFATMESPDENSSSSVYADVPVEQRVYAAIVISDDARSSPSFFLALNANGLEKFRQVLDFSSRSVEDQIEQCIQMAQPHVIAINACSRARNLSVGLDRTAKRLYESYAKRKQRQKNKNNDDDWRGWFVNYVLHDDFASAFASSKSARSEFAKEHVNLRRAFALARYLMEPLAVFCALATDSSLALTGPKPQTDVLMSISLHPLQDQLNQATLLESFERELINCVAITGVDLNQCVSFPHRAAPLNFVSGLGFRKSQKLVKELRGRGRLAKSRGELLRKRLVGAVVFANCAGFLAIGNRDDISNVEVEDSEEEEEEEDHVEEENEEENDNEAKAENDNGAASDSQTNSAINNKWYMKKTRMNLTRIHPTLQGDVCEMMVKLFCEYHKNGSSNNAALAFTLRKLSEIRHDPGFLEKRQTELFRSLQRNRSVHFDFSDAMLNGALSGDGLAGIFEEIFGRNGFNKELAKTGAFIAEELRFPRGERRQVLRRPSEQELAILCAGGEDVFRKDAEVVFEVINLPKMDTKSGDAAARFDSTVLGRVSGSNVRVQMRLLDGDVAPSSHDKYNQMRSMIRNCHGPNARDEVSRLLKMLEKEFGIYLGATLEGTVLDPTKTPLRVQLKLAETNVSNAVDSILADVSGGASKSSTWDEYFEKPDLSLQRPTGRSSAFGNLEDNKPAFRQRDIKHPYFRNWAEKEAEDYLSTPERKVGDCIIRPSSKGLAHLNLTWRWSKDPCKVETIPIDERNLDGTPKDPTISSLGLRLVMKEREFDALDEILALYIEPIAKRIIELQNHKYYRAMTLAEVEGLIKDQRMQNPASIPYYFVPHSTEKRVFYLVYQNTNDRPKRFRIIARPEGLDLLHKRGLRSINELVDYFKRHTKELEEANMRLANPNQFQQQQQQHPPAHQAFPPAFIQHPGPPAMMTGQPPRPPMAPYFAPGPVSAYGGGGGGYIPPVSVPPMPAGGAFMGGPGLPPPYAGSGLSQPFIPQPAGTTGGSNRQQQQPQPPRRSAVSYDL